MKVTRRWIAGVGLALAGVGLLLVIVALPNNLKSADEVSDELLRQELGCDRMTADYRETDPYCKNLALYRKLSERGIRFSASSTTSEQVTLALVSMSDGKAIANSEVVVSSAQSSETWRGRTDELGVVRIPRASLPQSADVTAYDLKGTPLQVMSDKAAYVVGMYK